MERRRLADILPTNQTMLHNYLATSRRRSVLVFRLLGCHLITPYAYQIGSLKTGLTPFQAAYQHQRLFNFADSQLPALWMMVTITVSNSTTASITSGI